MRTQHHLHQHVKPDGEQYGTHETPKNVNGILCFSGDALYEADEPVLKIDKNRLMRHGRELVLQDKGTVAGLADEREVHVLVGAIGKLTGKCISGRGVAMGTYIWNAALCKGKKGDKQKENFVVAGCALHARVKLFQLCCKKNGGWELGRTVVAICVFWAGCAIFS